ncbi:MAG TPA: primosomal replication protein N [Burkholderiaceae bacterium]|nr:primosomal replication protein N [Burkholderiaceae bacterium]
MNEIRLDGILVERAAMRHTPAGVPVVEAQIRHRSDVIEAGAPRTLEFVVNAIALGPIAGKLGRERLGAQLDLSGFLAPRSRRSSKLVLHLTGYQRQFEGKDSAEGKV